MKAKLTKDITFPCGTKYSSTLEFESQGDMPLSNEPIACPLHGKECRAPSLGTVIPFTFPEPTVRPTSGECTCLRPWHGVIPPPPCPVHGNSWRMGEVWCLHGTAPTQRIDHTGPTDPTF